LLTSDRHLWRLFNAIALLICEDGYRLATYRELLERIDYLEAIVGIRKGLDEFDQGKGIPAEQALATLQQKLSIPPRP